MKIFSTVQNMMHNIDLICVEIIYLFMIMKQKSGYILDSKSSLICLYSFYFLPPRAELAVDIANIDAYDIKTKQTLFLFFLLQHIF